MASDKIKTKTGQFVKNRKEISGKGSGFKFLLMRVAWCSNKHKNEP